MTCVLDRNGGTKKMGKVTSSNPASDPSREGLQVRMYQESNECISVEEASRVRRQAWPGSVSPRSHTSPATIALSVGKRSGVLGKLEGAACHTASLPSNRPLHSFLVPWASTAAPYLGRDVETVMYFLSASMVVVFSFSFRLLSAGPAM